MTTYRCMGILILMVLPVRLVGAEGKDDAPANRTVEEIKKTLAEINTPLDKKLDKVTLERTAALQRLKSYRYLAGVPYDDLVLDDEWNKLSEAAAKICDKIGRLDHNPKNPGMPEDEYKIAARGAGSSNLGMGTRNLSESVDGWMDDSDPSNIDRLGHRRWCLNPAMLKVGFGRTGVYTAMYSFDMSRKPVPEYSYVAWPPRGLTPVEYFKGEHAWNVSLNPEKYKKPQDKIQPNIYVVDKDGKKIGDALKLNYNKPDTQGFGVPYCLVFRPDKFSAVAGKRYLVEIVGVETRDGKAETIRYEVQFVKLK